jgi:hypothetical protein
MSELVFTRYLYNKELVLESLENAILQGLYEESLFWAYEIYFSGFENEVFQKCFEIFEIHYPNYKKLEKYLRRKEREWISSCENSKKDEVVAIVLKNMCSRKRDINIEEPIREMYIIIHPYEIEHFRTLTLKHPWETLPTLCIYKLRTTRISSEEEIHRNLEILRYQWLFYASAYTPIWKSRVLEYRGEIDILEKTVIFENDDSSEAFYEKYGFEPDEQSLETQKHCLGL